MIGAGSAAVESPPRIALLGTGVVGSALVARCRQLQARGIALPRWAWIGNSRTLVDCADAPEQALADARASTASPLAQAPDAVDLRAGDIVVDATASAQVADRHHAWLRRGIHVVTANKLGLGRDAAPAQEILDAAVAGRARYGDRATVGAGLPLLASIRALVAGGDRIHAIEGVLSGSLAWLFSQYDGERPFSALVRQARDAGFTEPDPREDLSGGDVRRKLLILARTAGVALDEARVQGRSLLPDALQRARPDEVDGVLGSLDASLLDALLAARERGEVLRFVGRFEAGGEASLGLRSLAPAHPLAGGGGTDNKVAIFSDRYREQPLLIQGPGAGAGVTAAALLDDVLAIMAG